MVLAAIMVTGVWSPTLASGWGEPAAGYRHQTVVDGGHGVDGGDGYLAAIRRRRRRAHRRRACRCRHQPPTTEPPTTEPPTNGRQRLSRRHLGRSASCSRVRAEGIPALETGAEERCGSTRTSRRCSITLRPIVEAADRLFAIWKRRPPLRVRSTRRHPATGCRPRSSTRWRRRGSIMLDGDSHTFDRGIAGVDAMLIGSMRSGSPSTAWPVFRRSRSRSWSR